VSKKDEKLVLNYAENVEPRKSVGHGFGRVAVSGVVAITEHQLAVPLAVFALVDRSLQSFCLGTIFDVIPLVFKGFE